MDIEIVPYDLDDDLIAAVKKDRMPRLRIYRPHDTRVVLGRGSKPDVELHLEPCLKDRIPVLKRRGGGCAVVVDPGNVIVSLVLPLGGLKNNQRFFNRLSKWLIIGLQDAGLEGVGQDGISDLVISDRKVGGACLYRSKEILFYSATLLVEPDLEKVERYLKHPPREPEYRQGREHRDFMARLAPGFWSQDADSLTRALRHTLHPGRALLDALAGSGDSNPAAPC
jgi:lipoate-protein ligase A